MADSPQPVNARIGWPALLGGGAALGFVLLFSLGCVAALLLASDQSSGLGASDWAALRFTLMQASLSTIVSTVLAIPLARALARRQFRGRAALVTLLGAPFILPVIVAIFGLVAIWGRSGLASRLAEMLGADRLDIYGLGGVVLAHVFFNLPLVTRLLLQGWSTIPGEHFRLAAQLGMGTRDHFRHLEWPMLRSVVPGAALLVFLLCLTSFAVALTLGGGPRATTIELAIYQALRFDFDLSNAANLALIQFTICLVAAGIALFVTRPVTFGSGLSRMSKRWDSDTPATRLIDMAVITVSFLFLAAPLSVIVIRGLPALVSGLPAGIWPAAAITIIIAVASACLATTLAFALAALIDALRHRRLAAAWILEAASLLMIAASPFVIGTGLFLMINPFVSPFALAFPITALVNAAISLPFALRVLVPAFTDARLQYGLLADSLGMEGFARFRYATWPLLRRPAGFAAGLSAALSAGDLGVIALFAPPGSATLPLYMYGLMGSYQMESAAGAALLLVTLSVALFWLFDRGGRIGHSV